MVVQIKLKKEKFEKRSFSCVQGRNMIKMDRTKEWRKWENGYRCTV